jgi:DNA polymerase-3 subunit epsilon
VHATAPPLRLFEPGYLSRIVPGIAAEEMTYAAFDVETTGLAAARNAVCEVAVVRFRGDGTVLDEYASLIDPRRPVAATRTHGITDADVRAAPTFAQACPDVVRMLSGAVVVAHNLTFEDGFLATELARASQPFPRLPGLCSLVTCRAQLEGPTYKLQSLFRTATGEWIADAHTALGDTRALAVLLPWLIAQAPRPLRYHGPAPAHDGGQVGEPGPVAPRPVRATRGSGRGARGRDRWHRWREAEDLPEWGWPRHPVAVALPRR